MRTVRRGFILIGCLSAMFTLEAKMNTGITKQPFGKTQDGAPVDLYALTNGHMTVKITNFGATVVSISTSADGGTFSAMVAMEASSAAISAAPVRTLPSDSFR